MTTCKPPTADDASQAPSTALAHAAQLWAYLSARRSHAPCDAVVVCCSYDLRVCDYACELIGRGIAPRLVLSGNTGNWTRHLWSVSEARVFLERALTNGIPRESITLEEHATNFGENIAYVRALLPDLTRITFVTKPNSVLRVMLTAAVRWPEAAAFIDAPPLAFPEQVSNIVGVLGAIDEMVGDIDRIVQYPALGFQAPHAVPQEILASCRALVAAGFRHHLLTHSTFPSPAAAGSHNL